MNLTIDREALLTALTRVSGIVARRGTVPILNNVLLDATADALTLYATDLSLQAVVTVPARVATRGRITVPASALTDLAKSVAEGAEIKMALNAEDGRLHVNAGRARWKLPTLTPDQFPIMAPTAEGWTATLPGADFGDAIGRTSWAISNDVGKMFINGVRLLAKNGFLSAIGTSGKEIAVAKIGCDAPDFVGVTVPGRTCQELVRFCADRPEVTLLATERLIHVEAPGASLTSKVIDLGYANYGRVMEIERAASFTVDRRALMSAVRRAMIGVDFADASHIIRLTVSEGVLSARGRSAYSEADDEIECEGWSGEEASIGVNSQAILDVLGVLKRDSVTVEFTPDRQIPLRIRGVDDDSIVCVSALSKVG